MNDPNTLPHSLDPTGPCPNCALVSSFEKLGEQPVGDSHSLFFLRCRGCQKTTAVIEKVTQTGPMGPAGRTAYEPVHWWPVPGAGQLDPDVPTKIVGAYDEGMRCLAVQAARASAVMFRSMLSFIVEDKGSSQAKAQRGLKGKLKQMSDDGSLHPSLADWAETIRAIGNGGAHPDELPEPTLTESEELGRLCRRMIEFLYEIDARILRSRRQGAGTP